MSVKKNKAKILVVDDNPDNIRMLIEILKEDFATIPATSGDMALNKLSTINIDIVLLDIIMPEKDGYETCRAIKDNPLTENIPVIFITALSEIMDDGKGFELGAVDYITKPFNPSTVKARVRNHVKLREANKKLEELYKIALDSNPISGLPGNNSIRKQIDLVVNKNSGSVVIYADLDNFKAFNDKYGFAHGDEVLKFTADLFKDVIKNIPPARSFLGHIGGDDFVMLIPLELVDKTIENIIARFDDGIRQFYNSNDLHNGYISATNRLGELEKFPIISISLAGVNLTQKIYKHFLSIVDACTEMKKIAKSKSGSNFILDNRID